MFGGIDGIVETLSLPIVIDWNGIPLGSFFEFVSFQSAMNSVINDYVKKMLLSKTVLLQEHNYGYDNYSRIFDIILIR